MSLTTPKDQNLISEIEKNSQTYPEPILLNIGAGPDTRTDGWLTVDFAETGWASFASGMPDINWDVTKGIPFDDTSVSGIYASHFLEHFTWFEGIRFLTECRRVLRPDAPIRIVVPDGDYFIDRFYHRDREFFNDASRCYNHWLGNMTDTFLWNIVGGFHDESRNFGCHAMLYNFENLSFRLSDLNFRDIERQTFDASQYEVFADEYKLFPSRTLPRDFTKSSLIVECKK